MKNALPSQNQRSVQRTLDERFVHRRKRGPLHHERCEPPKPRWPNPSPRQDFSELQKGEAGLTCLNLLYSEVQAGRSELSGFEQDSDPARTLVARGRGAVPILVALLFLGLGGCATRHRELAVPDVRQATDYTCGVSALQAVLAYYGIEAREDRLARELGADPDKGVNPPAIVKAAQARGLTAELRQGMTIREIAELVHEGSPVLVALQAWSDKPRSSYRDDWDDGHYAIIIAVNHDKVVFEDPSVFGSRAVLSRQEFEDRWHDTDGTQRYVRMGIIFGGKAPIGRPAPVRME